MNTFTRCDQTEAWAALSGHFEAHGRDFDLREAFARDAGRFAALSFEAPEVFADLSKNLVDVATLKFLLAAVVLLPLLPDRTFAPLDVVNPYKIGLLIVLIAGVEFAGYVAVRVLGPGRGLGLTGILGGLVSSTAVTLAASRRARVEPALVEAVYLEDCLAPAPGPRCRLDRVSRVALMAWDAGLLDYLGRRYGLAPAGQAGPILVLAARRP